MDDIPEPQIESRFPNCVALKLHVGAIAKPAPAGFMSSGATPPPTDLTLGLTVTFSGEQEIEVPGGKRLGLPGGRATFGVRRGELRFTLENCTLPLEKIALSKPFKVSIPIERQHSRSSEIQAGATLDTRTVGAKMGQGFTEKAMLEIFQVKKIGSEAQPAWIFEAYGDRAILEGSLHETPLGELCINQPPCQMTTTFIVRGEDVRITWGQIGLTKDIHRNKLALIERAIALRHIKSLIEAEPICTGRWNHG